MLCPQPWRRRDEPVNVGNYFIDSAHLAWRDMASSARWR